jgi:putative redox protein
VAPRIDRVTFPGSQGDQLSARLDRPAGPPRAFAVFAHCFTCSKDVRAASRIAAGLTEAGYAVLRFDFTGLGQSGGEFANTNFSSNAADLLAAVDWLRINHRAPQLLVGHSLGGSAVLAMAADVPEVRAVATLAAPADPAHVTAAFRDSIEIIERSGEAMVTLAGREFTIRRQFLDDLRDQVVTKRVAELDPAVLILHSPIDEVVSVDHAARLYTSARHPKSFVSLDGADHLLSDPVDAAYAASMIEVFADRYVADERETHGAPRASAPVVVAETGQGAFLNHVVVGDHRLLADEPESVGGFDAGPTPYDFLGIALGTCTSMTLRMYADRKSLPLDRVTVEVAHEKVHAEEAAECAEDRPPTGRSGKIDRFERTIRLEGPELTDEQRQRLLEIADRCPVHRTLEQSSVIHTQLDV